MRRKRNGGTTAQCVVITLLAVNRKQMVVRIFRFRIAGGWTRWYTDDDDLSFLHDNKEIEAMETHETMSREEAEKYLHEINH